MDECAEGEEAVDADGIARNAERQNDEGD